MGRLRIRFAVHGSALPSIQTWCWAFVRKAKKGTKAMKAMKSPRAKNSMNAIEESGDDGDECHAEG